MPRTPRWTKKVLPHGIRIVRMSAWKYFDAYIRQEMLDYRRYIWRGQRCSDWLLEPTLDRVSKRLSPKRRLAVAKEHLERFVLATRGRRGLNPPSMEHDNDWWALGQHHGLKTPLLDWTASPYAAAYFAFVGAGDPQTSNRTVYALTTVLDEENQRATDGHSGDERAPIIEFVRPLSDENARLVSQGALFTRSPLGVDIETWLRTYCPAGEKYWNLVKVTIPNRDRALALRSLNRMNINHLTLFPDLYGASKFCNTDLEIDNY